MFTPHNPSIYILIYHPRCLHSQSHHRFTNSYSIYQPITEVFNFQLTKINDLTLKMASAQVVKMYSKLQTTVLLRTPVTHHFQSRNVTPAFKLFPYLLCYY